MCCLVTLLLEPPVPSALGLVFVTVPCLFTAAALPEYGAWRLTQTSFPPSNSLSSSHLPCHLQPGCTGPAPVSAHLDCDHRCPPAGPHSWSTTPRAVFFTGGLEEPSLPSDLLSTAHSSVLLTYPESRALTSSFCAFVHIVILPQGLPSRLCLAGVCLSLIAPPPPPHTIALFIFP